MPKANRELARMRVVELYGQHLSERAIAKAIHKPNPFVHYWIRHYQLYGHVRDLPRRGRPRTLTDPLVHHIDKRMRNTRYQSIRKTAAQIRAGGIRISDTSVWRAARRSGLRAYVRKRKPLLTSSFRKRRLSYARKYGEHDWRKHMFGDEKTFYLFSLPNRKNDVVWASSGDKIEPQATVKNAPKVNVYAAISIEGRSTIKFFNENMTAGIYCDILEDTLLPAAERIYGNRSWTYVQDNDPKHTAKLTKEFIRINLKKTIPVEDWPPNSPDLNPIENLWSTLGERVARKNPTDIASMKKIIRQQWKKVATAEVRKALIDSIPFRLKQVIKNKGGHTKY
jgi:transposase